MAKQKQKTESKADSKEATEDLVKLDELVSQYEGKYWKSYIFITGIGKVEGGKATKEQLLAFISSMGPDTNLDDWLSDKDEVAAYIKANTIKNPKLTK